MIHHFDHRLRTTYQRNSCYSQGKPEDLSNPSNMQDPALLAAATLLG